MERITCLLITLNTLRIKHGFAILVWFTLFVIFKANTLNSAEFQEFIKEAMHNREEHILKEKNIVMKMDQRIARIFQHSQNVSGKHNCFTSGTVEKGKSHKLLRKALLKDEKEDKKREIEEAKDQVSSIPGLISEIDQLRAEIQLKTEKIEVDEKDQDILSKLFDMGIIDANGDLIKHNQNDDMS